MNLYVNVKEAGSASLIVLSRGNISRHFKLAAGQHVPWRPARGVLGLEFDGDRHMERREQLTLSTPKLDAYLKLLQIIGSSLGPSSTATWRVLSVGVRQYIVSTVTTSVPPSRNIFCHLKLDPTQSTWIQYTV